MLVAAYLLLVRIPLRVRQNECAGVGRPAPRVYGEVDARRCAGAAVPRLLSCPGGMCLLCITCFPKVGPPPICSYCNRLGVIMFVSVWRHDDAVLACGIYFMLQFLFLCVYALFSVDIFISFVFPRAVGLFVCFSRRCRLTVTKGAISSSVALGP